MIRCYAVDDEAYASEIIAGYILRTPGLGLVGTTTDPFEALRMIREGLIDLLFLDIQMAGLNGIQFLKICGSDCKVILTTAYQEYALEGFEHHVVDYLLKPIPYERFYKGIEKARHFLSPAGIGAESLSATAAPVVNDYLFVKGDTKNKFFKVSLEEITHVEGLKNYISIYLGTQRIITYQTLRDFETQLPKDQFIRVHKSYIVSFSHIQAIDGHTIFGKDYSIPIGQTYREAFFQAIRERR